MYRTPRYDEIRVGSMLYDSKTRFELNIRTIDDLTWFLLSQNIYENNDGVKCYGISLENYLIKDDG